MANLAQVSLETDNVFGDDGAAHQLATVTGDETLGFVATLTAPVDTTTEPTGGGAPRRRRPGRPGREPAERRAPVRRTGWWCTEWCTERIEYAGLTVGTWGLVLV